MRARPWVCGDWAERPEAHHFKKLDTNRQEA